MGKGGARGAGATGVLQRARPRVCLLDEAESSWGRLSSEKMQSVLVTFLMAAMKYLTEVTKG